MLVAHDIRAVFVESSVSDRNIRALIEGAAAQGHEVVIGGELYSDAMGAPGTYEGTYLGMIDHNVTTIARALGGQAPERGRIDELAMNWGETWAKRLHSRQQVGRRRAGGAIPPARLPCAA